VTFATKWHTHRVARAFLAASAACLVVLVLAATPASAIRTTHTVSAKGELVDRWTIDEPEECGLVGSGTLTVTFRTVTARVLPYIDPHQRNGRGSWIVGRPFGYKKSLIKDLPDSKASGTISRVDNTRRRPQADGTPCRPSPKLGCGTGPLGLSRSKPRPLAHIGRHDRRHIAVGLASEAFDLGDVDSCQSGGLHGWSSSRVLTGGSEDGDLLVKMPRASALKRRRTSRISATSRKTTVSRDTLNPSSGTSTDDVTRKVTVTFKRR